MGRWGNPGSFNYYCHYPLSCSGGRFFNTCIAVPFSSFSRLICPQDVFVVLGPDQPNSLLDLRLYCTRARLTLPYSRFGCSPPLPSPPLPSHALGVIWLSSASLCCSQCPHVSFKLGEIRHPSEKYLGERSPQRICCRNSNPTRHADGFGDAPASKTPPGHGGGIHVPRGGAQPDGHGCLRGLVGNLKRNLTSTSRDEPDRW